MKSFWGGASLHRPSGASQLRPSPGLLHSLCASVPTQNASFLLEKAHDRRLFRAFICACRRFLLTSLLVRFGTRGCFCRDETFCSFGGASVVLCLRVRLTLVAFLGHWGRKKTKPVDFGCDLCAFMNGVVLQPQNSTHNISNFFKLIKNNEQKMFSVVSLFWEQISRRINVVITNHCYPDVL